MEAFSPLPLLPPSRCESPSNVKLVDSLLRIGQEHLGLSPWIGRRDFENDVLHKPHFAATGPAEGQVVVALFAAKRAKEMNALDFPLYRLLECHGFPLNRPQMPIAPEHIFRPPPHFVARPRWCQAQACRNHAHAERSQELRVPMC